MRILPKEGPRAISAQLELDYWYNGRTDLFHPPERKKVKTDDGMPAEAVLLQSPSMSLPGTDFSMAILLVDKRVTDWASCWAYNRTASQELMLEDVDEDGTPDLSFRASAGWWGLQDKRKKARPGEKRAWIDAYAIGSKGLKSLFPRNEPEFHTKVKIEGGDTAVTLRVEGMNALHGIRQ